jgi:arylsulfatase A-like enzyme
MAEEGMLLTRHYAPAPVCAPSRASLMLGQHQGHANVRNNQFDKALANNHTIASVLKQAGYTTGLIGKWGLQGLEGDSPETWEAYPTKRGFDHFFGYVRHVDGHNHYPAHTARKRPPMELYHDQEEISAKLKGAYTTDLFTAAAKKWIMDQKQESPEWPFFLYLAYDTPHASLQVASAPYPEGGGLNGGIQWLGEKDNFINTVSDTVDHYLHPDYADQPWPDQQKRHASMVRRLDDAAGDLIQLLKDLQIDDETLVVFTSDNGPHAVSYGYGDFHPVFFDSYGEFDGIKRDVWEGGIRVPTIVRWPGRVKANQRNDTPSGFHDWLPTFAQVAGLPAPANSDGVSLLPTLSGEGVQLPGAVYIEYQVNMKTPEYEAFDPSRRGALREEMQVIYVDGYKGVRINIQDADDEFQIYNTLEDKKERINLAGSNDYFHKLQQEMKRKVLQIRRPDPSAPRPYDYTPVPALVSLPELRPGLAYQVFDFASPWPPAVASIGIDPAKVGVIDTLNEEEKSNGQNSVVSYEGFLEVPQTGEYTFFLHGDSRAVVRLHQVLLLDSDRGPIHSSMMEERILLEKGLHPFNLVFLSEKEENHVLDLNWEGPDFSRQPIAPKMLFHQNK